MQACQQLVQQACMTLQVGLQVYQMGQNAGQLDSQKTCQLDSQE